MKKHLAFLGLLMASAFSGFEIEAAPSCKELNELWRTKYHGDFKIRWERKPFDCPSYTAMTAKSIWDLEQAPTGYNYFTWTKALVRGITYDIKDCDHYAHMSSGVMTLCQKFFSCDDEGRVGTLVHEAAHGRSNDPGHVVCNHGKHEGKRSCDENLLEKFDGSGYNFEFMFYTQLLASGDARFDAEAIRRYLRNAVENNFNSVTEIQRRRWAPLPAPLGDDDERFDAGDAPNCVQVSRRRFEVTPRP